MEDLIRRSDAVAILEDLQKDHLQFCLIPFRQAIERVQAIPSAESTGDLDNAIYEYVKEGLMTSGNAVSADTCHLQKLITVNTADVG